MYIMYLDNMAVVKAMNDIAKTMEGGAVTPSAIRTALNARWTVDYIGSVEVDDIEISPVASGMERLCTNCLCGDSEFLAVAICHSALEN